MQFLILSNINGKRLMREVIANSFLQKMEEKETNH